MAIADLFTQEIYVYGQEYIDDGQGGFGSADVTVIGKLMGRIVTTEKPVRKASEANNRVTHQYEFYGETIPRIRAGHELGTGTKEGHYQVTSAEILGPDKRGNLYQWARLERFNRVDAEP